MLGWVKGWEICSTCQAHATVAHRHDETRSTVVMCAIHPCPARTPQEGQLVLILALVHGVEQQARQAVQQHVQLRQREAHVALPVGHALLRCNRDRGGGAGELYAGMPLVCQDAQASRQRRHRGRIAWALIEAAQRIAHPTAQRLPQLANHADLDGGQRVLEQAALGHNLGPQPLAEPQSPLVAAGMGRDSGSTSPPRSLPQSGHLARLPAGLQEGAAHCKLLVLQSTLPALDLQATAVSAAGRQATPTTGMASNTSPEPGGHLLDVCQRGQ